MKITTESLTQGKPGELPVAHHEDLDRWLDEVVAQAHEGEVVELRREWAAFERELLGHMELEEVEILPEFARQDAKAARTILADHAQIRRELLELGSNLDLHFLRAEEVDAFAGRLSAHAAQEETALYAWAGRQIGTSRWNSIKAKLLEAARAGRSAVRFEQGIR